MKAMPALNTPSFRRLMGRKSPIIAIAVIPAKRPKLPMPSLFTDTFPPLL